MKKKDPKKALKEKAKKIKKSPKFWEEEAMEPAHQDIFKKSKSKPKKKGK